MNEESRKDVIARLRSIAGHLKAVERMVEEDKYCVDVLKQTNGNKLLAAKILGLDRRALYRRLDRYGIGTVARRSKAQG